MTGPLTTRRLSAAGVNDKGKCKVKGIGQECPIHTKHGDLSWR
jgi:hypothetical protein